MKAIAVALAGVVLLQSPSWEPIFNGRNLDGWVAKITHHELGMNFGDTFRVENGVLKVSYDRYTSFDGQFGHLFFQRKLARYRLRIEYRFTGSQAPGGADWARSNSGVMLHAQDPATMLKNQDFPISLEAQFLGNGRSTANVCTPGTEIFMKSVIVKAHCTDSAAKPVPDGEWITTEIAVDGGGRIRHFVNGVLVLEYERPEIGGGVVNGFDPAAKRDGTPLGEGYVALQSESHPIEFRRVELLTLK